MLLSSFHHNIMYKIICFKATRGEKSYKESEDFKEACKLADQMYEFSQLLFKMDFSVSGISVMVKDSDGKTVYQCGGY